MSLSFYWLVVGALVVWRFTHLLQAEDGPWNIITAVRRLAGNSVFGELLDCFYCLSLWVAAPVAYALSDNWLERFWHWPALSGAAILLERLGRESPPPLVGGSFGENNHVLLREEPSPGHDDQDQQQ